MENKKQYNYINNGGFKLCGCINTGCREQDKLFFNYRIYDNIIIYRFYLYKTIINIYENKEKIINEYNII